MLECLIGRQRSAETVAIEHPLGRHRQHGVEDPDDLRALEHQATCRCRSMIAGVDAASPTTADSSTSVPLNSTRA